MIKQAQGKNNQFNFVKTSYSTRNYKNYQGITSERAEALNGNVKALKGDKEASKNDGDAFESDVKALNDDREAIKSAKEKR